jgi:hypothetical protein
MRILLGTTHDALLAAAVGLVEVTLSLPVWVQRTFQRYHIPGVFAAAVPLDDPALSTFFAHSGARKLLHWKVRLMRQMGELVFLVLVALVDVVQLCSVSACL